MTSTLQLGYLVLEVSDFERWVEFARSELGLVTEDAGGGSVYLRMDGFQQRFAGHLETDKDSASDPALSGV